MSNTSEMLLISNLHPHFGAQQSTLQSVAHESGRHLHRAPQAQSFPVINNLSIYLKFMQLKLTKTNNLFLKVKITTLVLHLF